MTTYQLTVTDRQLRILRGLVKGFDINGLQNVVDGATEIKYDIDYDPTVERPTDGHNHYVGADCYSDCPKNPRNLRNSEVSKHDYHILTNHELDMQTMAMANYVEENGYVMKNRFNYVKVETEPTYPTDQEYLYQSTWWNSKDKGWIKIEEMNPRHAANCCLWIVENTSDFISNRSSDLHILYGAVVFTELPIYKALKKRANARG